MKQCSKCKINKKNSEFNKETKSKDKLGAWCKSCQNAASHETRSTKKGYLNNALSKAKTRAKNKQIAFELDIEYLRSIATDECPVFGVNLMYASSQKGTGYPDPHAAALDRIIPELGYVKGNVVFISNWANRIKSDATEIQLYAVADWLHYKRKEVLNAFKEQLAPVPEGPNIKSKYYTQPGTIPTTGAGQDSDDTHHHSRTIHGQDTDHSPQTSGGDGMGCRGEKMATLVALARIESNGEPDAETVRLEYKGRYILD